MTDERIVGGFLQPVGAAFADPDLMFVWERSGLVHVVDHGVRLPTPLIDLRDEVGSWRDFGLLGFALDPAFWTNGRFYLAYVVDRHHLLHWGTPAYDPRASEYFSATIVRVTRYTADPAAGFKVALPASRHVLLGESITTGVPSVHNSHGACQLVFGRDGTLLVATGDGASFVGIDTGSNSTTYWEQALADGILTPATNVGALRAQQIDSLCGKILRLDPATGDGVPSNPFYQAAAPRSARSRVWALGFRNPCRMSLRPGTGSTDPSLAAPGELYVGDVGASSQEELDIVREGGHDYGWPLFQGLGPNTGFAVVPVANQFAPNPIAGGGCAPYFTFQDLLRQATATHTQFFPNPCNAAIGIAPTTPTFLHTLPALEWKHDSPEARVAVFSGNSLTFEMIGTTASGVSGAPFEGNASIGGTWHSGLTFPPSFGPCYYQADFGGNWIRRLQFDALGRLTAAYDFATVTTPLMLVEHPRDHSLVYVSYSGGDVRRIAFGIEPAPTASPMADVTWGPSTLEVQLDARASSDPQGQALTYEWDLGFGRRSTAAQLGHKFTGTGVPTVIPVRLTVTDTMGARATTTLPIAVDDTPPVVAITSLRNGDPYALSGPTTAALQGAANDAEHGASQLTWSWQTSLYHGNHVHAEPVDHRQSPTVVLSPTPRDGEFYAYRVQLQVTDPCGLSGSHEVWLFPDTTGASTTVAIASPFEKDRFLPGAPVPLAALVTGPVTRVDYYANGQHIGTATAAPWSLGWTPAGPGRQTIVAIAVASDATSSCSRAVAIEVETPRRSQFRVGSRNGDAHETLSPTSPPDQGNRTLVLGDDGAARVTGIRCEGLAIPPGSRVLSAWLEFTANADDPDAANLQIACQDTVAPLPILPAAGNLAARPVRGTVTWTPPPWNAGRSTAAQRTPDLGAAIAPLVASPKWNRSLVFLARGTGLRRAFAWDGNAPVAPLLTVDWLPPPPPLLQQAIAIGADDATEGIATGIATYTQGSLPLGSAAGAAQMVGLRWTLPLQRGTRILGARVRFTAAAVGIGPAAMTLRYQVADNAPSFVNTRYAITSRPRSATSAQWVAPDWNAAGESGSAQRTGDLSQLVQEVIDRPGWQAGNGLVLLVTGTGARAARSFEAGAATRPLLEIEYEAPTK